MDFKARKFCHILIMAGIRTGKSPATLQPLSLIIIMSLLYFPLYVCFILFSLLPTFLFLLCMHMGPTWLSHTKIYVTPQFRYPVDIVLGSDFQIFLCEIWSYGFPVSGQTATDRKS